MRQRILKEATRLFAAQGFEGTSLSEISDAVGIRKPSLLYHFPSKEDLRRNVLDGLLSHWNEALPRLLAAATREDQFDAVMEALCSFFLEDTDRARLMVREALDRPDDMRERLDMYVKPWVAIVAGQIEKAQAAGRVYADVDPQAYCLQIVNLVVGGVAIHDSLSVALADSDRGPAQERLVQELNRIARASLYPAA